VAFEDAHLSSCGHLPQFDLALVTAFTESETPTRAGGQEPPIGTERHGIDQVGVAFEGLHFSSRGHLHSLIVSSEEPDARSFPSGLNATELTPLVWPSNVRITCQLLVSMSCTQLPPCVPTARYRPSGEKTTDSTSPKPRVRTGVGSPEQSPNCFPQPKPKSPTPGKETLLLAFAFLPLHSSPSPPLLRKRSEPLSDPERGDELSRDRGGSRGARRFPRESSRPLHRRAPRPRPQNPLPFGTGG